MTNNIRALLQKKSFVLFLLSQGVSNLGDSFRLIAVTVLIYKLTGSGTSAALGLILTALPSIFLSPFAGALGDLFPEKYLMALIDFIRGIIVLLFIINKNITGIYLLLVFLSVIDMLYSPPRRKIIVSIAGKNGVLNANSLLTGISGAAFLVGPLAAGILTDRLGTDVAFILNCFLSIASSILILFIKSTSFSNKKGTHNNAKSRKLLSKSFFSGNILNEMIKGYKYYKSNSLIKEIVIINIITSYCMVSINMSFYPFAFDILNVTAKGWSLMISIYYGTNLLSMALVFLLPKNAGKYSWQVIYGGLMATAAIWFLYRLTTNMGIVILLQFIEGTILAVCGILLSTQMQIVTDKNYMARIAGLNDVATSFGKIAGMSCTFAVLTLSSYKAAFLLNSFVLLLFAFLKLTLLHSSYEYQKIK